jgi:hypothetical protein
MSMLFVPTLDKLSTLSANSFPANPFYSEGVFSLILLACHKAWCFVSRWFFHILSKRHSLLTRLTQALNLLHQLLKFLISKPRCIHSDSLTSEVKPLRGVMNEQVP